MITNNNRNLNSMLCTIVNNIICIFKNERKEQNENGKNSKQQYVVVIQEAQEKTSTQLIDRLLNARVS